MRNLFALLLLPAFMMFQEGQVTHIRSGATLPAICSPATGDIFFKTGSGAGLYLCTAANTWTAAINGTGASNQLALWNSATTLAALGAATNGQIPIGSAGVAPVLGVPLGTANQVIVSTGAGSLTFSLPQNIHTGATPQFSSLGLGVAAGASGTLSTLGKLILYNNSAPVDGQLLIGDTAGSSFDAATLTAGTGVTITNAGGSITIAIGQAVATSSNVTFNNVTSNGTLSAATIAGAGGGGITISTSSGDIGLTPTGNTTSTTLALSAAAPTVGAGKVGYGSTTSAAASCGSLMGSAGCLVINVAGTTRNIPFY